MGFFDAIRHEIKILTTEMDQDSKREEVRVLEERFRSCLQTAESALRKLRENEIRTLYVQRQKDMVNQELREREIIEKKSVAFFQLTEKTEMEYRKSAKDGWVDTKDIQLDIDSKDENDFFPLSSVKK